MNKFQNERLLSMIFSYREVAKILKGISEKPSPHSAVIDRDKIIAKAKSETLFSTVKELEALASLGETSEHDDIDCVMSESECDGDLFVGGDSHITLSEQLSISRRKRTAVCENVGCNGKIDDRYDPCCSLSCWNSTFE